MKTPALLALLLPLALGLQAQTLPNPGFESVTYDSVTSSYIVDGWTLDGFGGGVTTSPHAGSYAVEVWNWYWYSPGIARNGSIPGGLSSLDYLQGGTPIADSPTRLEGFYRYDTTQAFRQTVGPDSAVIAVGLKRWNAALGQVDTVALHLAHLPTTGVPATWQPFSIDIPYLLPGTAPDSIVVTLRSSISGFCSAASPGTCLYLAVDDLDIISTQVDGREVRQPLELHPNPAVERAHFSMEGMLPSDLLVVTDLTGRTLLSQSAAVLQGTLPLQAWGLAPGTYLVSLHRQGTTLAHSRLVVR